MRRRSLLSIHMVSSRVSHHALASLPLAGFGTVAFLDLDLELEKKWLSNPFVSMAAQHAVLAYSFRMTDHEKCVGPMGKFTRSYLSTRQMRVDYSTPDSQLVYFKGCALFFEVAFWSSPPVREFASAWENEALVYFNRSDGKDHVAPVGRCGCIVAIICICRITSRPAVKFRRAKAIFGHCASVLLCRCHRPPSRRRVGLFARHGKRRAEIGNDSVSLRRLPVVDEAR